MGDLLKSPRRLLLVVRRLGTWGLTAALSLASVALSVLLGALLDVALKGQVVTTDLLISAVIPALLAPLLLYGLIRLAQELDRAQLQLARLATRA